MPGTVIVVGGGYAGSTAAKLLDDVADVVLIEPKEAFVHNVAALRALVDPSWTERVYFPYDRLLCRGRVLRDRAVRVEGGRRRPTVTLASGRRIDADFAVLATGSGYPFPAKVDVDDTATAVARFRATRRVLDVARSVLLLGAGPVGLELAGEIASMWPGKAITIVDPASDILGGGFHQDFRAELRRQLAELGVHLVLGDRLRALPATEPGHATASSVLTRSGRRIVADVWFRCFGVAPVSDYLGGGLAASRRASGHVEVTAELRLPVSERVFAIGDVTALAETKLAKAAMDHAEVVAATIRALVTGEGRPVGYRPAPPGISLPLGPRGGASYAPGVGVLGPDRTAELKGTDLKIDAYRRLFGIGAGMRGQRLG